MIDLNYLLTIKKIMSQQQFQLDELMKKAYDLKVNRVGSKKVDLKIRWLDVKGAMKSDIITIREGDRIEF